MQLMNKHIVFLLRFLLATVFLAACSQKKAIRSLSVYLPNQENNMIKKSWPAITTWFWTAEEFKPEGYKRVIDRHYQHSKFDLLTVSIRYPMEKDRYSLSILDSSVHAQIKAAAEYAAERGIGLVFQLDEPFAREEFAKKYPDELQELVSIREIALTDHDTAEIRISSINLGGFYEPLYWKLLRVYMYDKDDKMIGDITKRATMIPSGKNAVKILVKCNAGDSGYKARILTSYSILKADVFAPHLIEFEKDILMKYAEAKLAGICKDEWGFPNRFDPSPNDLWYSKFMAAEYKKRRPGHDLLADMCLMYKEEKGKEQERIAAINHYMEMNWQRNGEIETAYYHSIKSVFGEQAMIATHPTWFPYPGAQEAFRNGIHWWVAKRDLAQTDESVPFSIRTSLSKKWQSPLWYNMYYSSDLRAYEKELWRSVLAGGRINFHQLYPYHNWQGDTAFKTSLLNTNLLKANNRIQMLNYISTMPADCRVAVVFSHPAICNWAEKEYRDAGMIMADSLWQLGYYADLIPSSEIGNGALTIGEDGGIRYNMQRYDAVILYHPQFERSTVASFFNKAALTNKTALYCIGEWTKDFEGNPYDGLTELPKSMKQGDMSSTVTDVAALLESRGVERNTPSVLTYTHEFRASMAPKLNGRVRLIDGTVIIASGEKNVLGDSIKQAFTVDDKQVTVDAIGIAAVRFNPSGDIEAMAAGGMKSFAANGISIVMPERADIALWRNKDGKWEGVLQGYKGKLPEELKAITRNWVRIE